MLTKSGYQAARALHLRLWGHLGNGLLAEVLHGRVTQTPSAQGNQQTLPVCTCVCLSSPLPPCIPKPTSPIPLPHLSGHSRPRPDLGLFLTRTLPLPFRGQETRPRVASVLLPEGRRWVGTKTPEAQMRECEGTQGSPRPHANTGRARAKAHKETGFPSSVFKDLTPAQLTKP